jgi:hypothetical protein
VMEEALTDRFDGAGAGRWEMKGYELMSAMQNRVPVGVWFDTVPVANVSDAAYDTAGNQGGTKDILIGTEHLPDFDLGIKGQTGGDDSNHNNTTAFAMGDKLPDEAGFTFNKSNLYSYGKALGTYAQRMGIKHSFTVVVYAKRI